MTLKDVHRRLAALPPDLIDQETEKALSDVGDIIPRQSPDDPAVWLFSHPLYDVEAEGDSPEDCIATYKRWMRIFIQERLIDNLAPNVEAASPGRAGRGGARVGAGRPVGTKKAPTRLVRVPEAVADWLLEDKQAHSDLLLKWVQQQKA